VFPLRRRRACPVPPTFGGAAGATFYRAPARYEKPGDLPYCAELLTFVRDSTAKTMGFRRMESDDHLAVGVSSRLLYLDVLTVLLTDCKLYNAEKGRVRDEILVLWTRVGGMSICCYVDCGTFATCCVFG